MDFVKRAAIVVGGFFALKTGIVLTLNNFKLSEFGISFPFLSIGLLLKLDKLRDELGVPLSIVEADSGGLMRFGSGDSQHYFGRAADLKKPVGVSDAQLLAAAKKVGFTGVGIYPNTFHVDVRPGERVATWGGVPKVGGGWDYVAITHYTEPLV